LAQAIVAAMAILRVAALAALAYGAACLLSQAFVAPGPVAAERANRVAMRAAADDAMDPDMQTLKSGPVFVYMQALMDAASKKEESVPVTKDVMKYKATMENLPKELADEFETAFNVGGVAPAGMTEDQIADALTRGASWLRTKPASDLEQAEVTLKKLGPWESTVFPKFVTFLAKKRRLGNLQEICESYIANLYIQQSIAPVVVTAAQQLTDQQAETIKDKIKKKIGAADIKLVTRIDNSLISGFKIEWGFQDPEKLENGPNVLDLSLKEKFNAAILSTGMAISV